MGISIVSIAAKMPDWVVAGCEEYSRRLSKEYSLNWIDVAPEVRAKTRSIDKIKQIETQKLLKAVPERSLAIVLDERGQLRSSAAFAKRLEGWLEQSSHVSFLIGGADGMSPDLKQIAGAQKVQIGETLAISPLTFPHPLVRVILAEQLYRAWSINHGHPYHRE